MLLMRFCFVELHKKHSYNNITTNKMTEAIMENMPARSKLFPQRTHDNVTWKERSLI